MKPPALPHHLAVCRKPDLDTLMAALLAGVERTRPLRLAPGLAEEALLADPAVLCLECGGSGQVDRLNFDHHGPSSGEATAAEQVWAALGRPEEWAELVAYVAWVDSAGGRGRRPPPVKPETPHLSGLLSGLFLTAPDLETRFWGGLALLAEVRSAGLPPWSLEDGLAAFPAWRACWAAKRQARLALAGLAGQARRWRLPPGGPDFFLALSSPWPGVHGFLKGLGATGRLAHRPGGHFTLSVEPDYQPWLRAVEKFLNGLEPGWGGPAGGLILGSPFGGSRFSRELLERLLATMPPMGASADESPA